jgi:hypothetical protein
VIVAAALALSLLAPAANKAPASDDRTLIYVDDVVPADKTLSSDANALTTSLCAALSKDKRLDVLCAPDVKQILSFAATAAMVGTNGGPGSAIQQRMEKTKIVVSSTFKKASGKYVLVLKAGPKAAEAQATAMFTDKPIIALEESGDQQKQILDKMDSLASKLSGAVFAGSSAASTTAPPAPLPKK